MTTSPTLGIVAAVAQSVIFIGYDLIAKRLRERGVDSLHLSHALRHALVPSLIVLALAWDAAAIDALMHNQIALWALFGFLTSALVFQWVYFKCLHVSHSLTVASVTRNAIGLPLLMVLGMVVNGDRPTAWGVASLGFLIAASFVKPGRTKLDPTQYIDSIRTVIGLSIAFVVLVTIKDPLYRLFMQNTRPLILGVAIYMVAFSAALHVFFALRPIVKTTAKAQPKEGRWLMLAVPVAWVAGTIPEGIAFGLLPVYSLIAIGTVSWMIKIGSDLYFKRLAPTGRTALFAALVLGSITLSIVERNVV